MAMVMITCPATNRQVPTGIETDPASIALVPPINARLTCPDCGNVHTWSVLDAELVCEALELPDRLGTQLALRLQELTRQGRARRHQ
jgi:hypothetical protein